MVVSPGQPPPGMEQFQGFGTPPPGSAGPAPPQPTKSRLGLWIGIGCGCLFIASIVVGLGIWLFVSSVGPGDEVSTVNAQPNVPFTLSYTQDGSDQREIWMDLDVSYTQGLRLTGPINISKNNQVIGQYNLELTGSGSPIRERSSRRTVNWVSTNISGSGSTSGKTFLFPLPAYEEGATITLSGTVTAAQGLTARQLRIFVTD